MRDGRCSLYEPLNGNWDMRNYILKGNFSKLRKEFMLAKELHNFFSRQMHWWSSNPNLVWTEKYLQRERTWGKIRTYRNASGMGVVYMWQVHTFPLLCPRQALLIHHSTLALWGETRLQRCAPGIYCPSVRIRKNLCVCLCVTGVTTQCLTHSST